MVEWQCVNWEEYAVSDMNKSQIKVEGTTGILFVEDFDTTTHTAKEQVCLYNLTQELDILPCPSNIEKMHLVSVYQPQVGRLGPETYYAMPTRIKTRHGNNNAMAVSVLKAHFHGNTKLSYFDKENLAKETGMTIPQVSLWFDNKRNRM